MLRLFTFGGLRIERDGRALPLPTSKASDLLAYLLTFRDRHHPRSVLAGVLWPDLPESKARRRLSDALWRTRRVLGDHIAADEERLWLGSDLPYWLDVEEFLDAISNLGARRIDTGAEADTSASSNPVPRLESLHRTLELYRGPFLEGLYHEWVLLERERLRGLYLEALGRLLEWHKRGGDYEVALSVARRLVAAEPLHEAGHRELMRLYHMLGRDAEAVAQYRRCREILRERLDVEPAPETQALYHVLSRQGSAPSVVREAYLPAPARRPLPDLDHLPLVGRDAERSTLLSRLERAAAGCGGVVLLEGEAGIGKTRLVQELIQGARWRGIDTAQGLASQGARASYGLFVEALGSLLTPLRLQQLAHLVDPGHLQAAARVLPEVSRTLDDGVPLPELPPPRARERLQEALVTLVLGLDRIVTHFWVLEDLQWADAESLSLLPLLAPDLEESRTLFLLTGRTAELRERPEVWRTLQALDRAGPFLRYRLDRLDQDTVGSLLDGLLLEQQPALVERLALESDGVPLYVVEALKSWRDEGHLLPTESGVWRWSGDALDELPAYVSEGVIGHRLSRLSPVAQEALAAAAVIGVKVDFDLLISVCASASPGSELETPDAYLLATDELLRLGLLMETDVGYRFSHDKVRQAVYESLPITRRRSLHKRVARAVERLFPERLEVLAHHFVGAGERDPALYYLERAAARARDIYAHQAALECYDRQLDLLPRSDRPVDRYGVLRDRAEVLGWIGERGAQGRDLEEMLDLARSLDDDARLAESLHLRSEWHRVQGRYEEANRDALAALEIYDRLEDEAARAALLGQIGRNLLDAEDYARAVSYLQAALPIHETTGDLVGQIRCLIGLARVAQGQGDLSRAQAYCQRSLELAEAADDLHWISYTLSSVGLGYVDLGDLDAAEAHLRRALDLAETSGARRRRAVTRVRLAHIALQRGGFEAAHAYLHAALETLREVQDLSWEAYALGILGEVDLLRGDPIAAKGHLEASYERHIELGEYDYAALNRSYLALAELALGNESAAWEHSRKVMAKAAAEWLGPECPPEVCYNHYRVARATRRWAAARAAIEKAARVLDERAALISDPVWRGQYRTGLRVNRAITEAMADQPPPGQLRVRLARADAPAHRRPNPEETVEVTWTVDAAEEDAALAEREGRVTLRRQRILRLLQQAQQAGALPAVADLAGALEVSSRTIRSDLSALREQGHAAPTRGHRA